MPQTYSIRLGSLEFTYHIDRGDGRHFATSLPMIVTPDVLTVEEQAIVKQRIFELLTKDKKDCVLKNDR